MSADAKVWKEDAFWSGIHDGECEDGPHKDHYYLSELLVELEMCFGYRLRWELKEYKNGLGLAGYVA